MTTIQTILDYMLSDEVEHWENETGLEYEGGYDENASPNHILHALVKLKRADENIKGLYVTPDIAEVNHGLVYGDNKEDALENAKNEWQGFEIDEGNMQPLSEFIGL